jgi:hypothetical protein
MRFQTPDTSQPYSVVSLNGRRLQIPNAEDRRRHREIYAELKHLCPVKWEPEQIQSRIREALRGRSGVMALRTDLQNCFDTIPQHRVKSQIEALSLPNELKRGLFRSSTHSARLANRQPTFPWLAELVLRDVDAAMTDSSHIRHGTPFWHLKNVEAKRRLEAVIKPLGCV